LFSFPKVMAITAVVMLTLGVVPGLPTIPFFLLAGGCGLGAWLLHKEEKTKEEMDRAAVTEDASSALQREPENYMDYAQVETLEVEIGYGLISLADDQNGGDLLDRISGIRRQAAHEI